MRKVLTSILTFLVLGVILFLGVNLVSGTLSASKKLSELDPYYAKGDYQKSVSLLEGEIEKNKKEQAQADLAVAKNFKYSPGT